MVPICLVPLVPVSKSDFGCRGPLFGGELTLKKARLDPARACCHNRQASRAWLIQRQREYVMAKRKLSTFERLQRGERLNRKERREVQQRLNLDDPGLDIIQRDAAGIDVGNESHFVSVPPDRNPQPIREFGSWTAALEEMARWLKDCRIRTVVMQSTGVYWFALHDVLQRHGLEVNLVDARGTKNVPGRKSDVQECQWLRKLHTYGLLRPCFLPPPEIHAVRTLWRLRSQHVRDAGRCIHGQGKGTPFPCTPSPKTKPGRLHKSLDIPAWEYAPSPDPSNCHGRMDHRDCRHWLAPLPLQTGAGSLTFCL